MKIKIIIALLFVSSQLLAQTIIKDKQEVYGKWKKSGSPYIIKGEAIIPAGKTLTIKPGVVVKFKTGTQRDYRMGGYINKNFDLGFLRVRGKLVAKGKKKKLIVFTRDENYGYWGNVFFNSGKSNNELKYCKIEASYYIRSITMNDNATGAFTFLNSIGKVENCLIVNNGWTGLNCKQGGNPLFVNNTVYGNNYGIECNTESSPTILNCIIWDNKTASYINNNNNKPSLQNSLYQENYIPRDYENKGGNITGKDPLFKDARNGDFRLKSNSPCKKAGINGGYIGALK